MKKLKQGEKAEKVKKVKNLDHCKKFSERLLELRTERNLTMEALAEAADIGVSTISQYENCVREPQWINILKLIRYFKVSSDYLMGEKDERNGCIL